MFLCADARAETTFALSSGIPLQPPGLSHPTQDRVPDETGNWAWDAPRLVYHVPREGTMAPPAAIEVLPETDTTTFTIVSCVGLRRGGLELMWLFRSSSPID